MTDLHKCTILQLVFSNLSSPLTYRVSSTLHFLSFMHETLICSHVYYSLDLVFFSVEENMSKYVGRDVFLKTYIAAYIFFLLLLLRLYINVLSKRSKPKQIMQNTCQDSLLRMNSSNKDLHLHIRHYSSKELWIFLQT